jgi:hypothetical protein
MRVQSGAEIARRTVSEIKPKKVLKFFLYILKYELQKNFMNLITETQIYLFIYLYIVTVCRYIHKGIQMHTGSTQTAISCTIIKKLYM